MVTGGGGGIGRYVCRDLAQLGHRVFAANRQFSEPFLQEVGDCDVVPMIVDLATPDSVDAFAASLDGEGSEIVGAILLASPPPNIGLLATLQHSVLKDHLSVSVIGHHQLIAALIERHWQPRAQGAVLAVLTSALSENGTAPTSSNMGGYVVAKAALGALLQCYRKDYPWLHTAVVSPSFTRTDMLEAFDDRYIELLNEQGKIDEPDAIAAKIVSEFCATLKRES